MRNARQSLNVRAITQIPHIGGIATDHVASYSRDGKGGALDALTPSESEVEDGADGATS